MAPSRPSGANAEPPLRLLCQLAAPLPLIAGLAALGCGGSDLVLPSAGGAPVQIGIVQGNQQAGPAGAPLADSLVVRLTDQAGNGVPDLTVAWQIAAGGGSAAPASVTSDASGLAAAEWTLGSPGQNTLNAVVSGVGRVTFTATGNDGDGAAGATLELIEGDGQSAPAGSHVLVQPAVRVTDGSGHPVPGVAVTFVVTGGGGSVDKASQSTNGDGIARTGWTLGAGPGTNTLEARAEGLQGSPVVFSAEGMAGGDVDHFKFQVQPHDVRQGERQTIQVAMVDAAGKVVPRSGVIVYLGLFSGGNDVPSNGLLAGDRFQPSQNGVIEFNLGVTKEGRYRFRVLSDQLPGLGPHGPEPFVFSNSFDVR
jgi:hypothetical protein